MRLQKFAVSLHNVYACLFYKLCCLYTSLSFPQAVVISAPWLDYFQLIKGKKFPPYDINTENYRKFNSQDM